jgi:probable HAF family extracellular repeat protein
MNVPCAFLTLAMAAFCSAAVATDRYRVTAIDASIVPVKMNSSGDVAGYAVGPDGGRRAVVWRGGTVIDLGTLGGADSEAFGINDDGRVVGYADTAAAAWRAFLYSDGVMTDLGTLPGGTASVATGINAAGRIVGYSQVVCGDRCPSCPTCMVSRAFLYEDGTMKDLGLPGVLDSWAAAINRNGDIAGGYRDEQGNTRAFVVRGGTMTDLGVGTEFGNASDVNDLGHVVGAAGPYIVESGGCVASGPLAFLWASGVVFGPETSQQSSSRATGINNRDQIVGDVFGCGEAGGFLWEAGRSYDLDSLLMPDEDWHIEHALAINDRGRIAAMASRPDSPAMRPVLLDPVPSSSLPLAVEY